MNSYVCHLDWISQVAALRCSTFCRGVEEHVTPIIGYASYVHIDEEILAPCSTLTSLVKIVYQSAKSKLSWVVFYIWLAFCIFWLFITVVSFAIWQEYGDSVDIDGFDVDYGVRRIKSIRIYFFQYPAFVLIF